MIQPDFVGEDDRTALTVPAREGRLPCQTTRRANASVLLDDGWSARQVAHALLLDEATLRGFRKLFERGGSEGLESFEVGGSTSDPAHAQKTL